MDSFIHNETIKIILTNLYLKVKPNRSYFVRRKKACMSGKTHSLYAKVEIRRNEDSTYQQLNISGLENENANQLQDISYIEPNNTYQQLDVSELENENANQQQTISDVEPNNTYQQLNVSELDPSNAYQQLNVTESNPVNTYQQLYVVGTDNANQQQDIYQN